MIKSLRYRVALFTMIIFSLHSCQLHYTTKDINSQLNKVNKDVNNNYSKLSKQFEVYKQNYEALGCPENIPPYKEANSKLKELNSVFQEIEKSKKTINKEYTYFKNYTNGIKKIVSNSEEWGKLKTTKKTMKSQVKEIKNSVKTLKKKSEDFDKFINKEITPIVKYQETKEFEKQIQTIITNINQSKTKLIQESDNFQKKSFDLLETNKTKYPKKCAAIKTCLEDIKNQEFVLDQITINVEQVLNNFKKETKGIPKIYSCSPQWSKVENAQSELKNQQTLYNNINSDINLLNKKINTLISEISK